MVTIVGAVCSGSAGACEVSKDCERNLLSVSALNHAANIMESLMLLKMLSGSKHQEVLKYLQAHLKNEVEVSKTILLQLTINLEKVQQNKEFDNSVIGGLMLQLLSKEIVQTESLASFLPAHILCQLGEEGTVLFDAVYRNQKSIGLEQ